MKLSPLGWAILPLKRYAAFSGRSSRAELWWFFLFVFVLYIVIAGALLGTFRSLTGTSTSVGFTPVFAFIFVFWLAVFIPSLAVQFRRLHDTDRSGWWLGGFWLVYLGYVAVTVGVPGLAGDGGIVGAAGMMIIGLAMFAYSILLLVFFCLPGTKGANRFGEDPYGADMEDVFA